METQLLHGIAARPDDARIVTLVDAAARAVVRGAGAPLLVGVSGPEYDVYRVFIAFGEDEFARVCTALAQAGLREAGDWSSSYVFRLHRCFG
jgi:hypothetical protein